MDRKKNGANLDALSYQYNGNQLIGVEDTSGNVDGFADGATEETEYGYDANGNMVFDANKGITSITYNHLNLPELVTKDNGEWVRYTYDAAGIKLRKQTSGDTVDYVVGKHYKNGELEFFQHSEGRILVSDNSYQYEYNLTDHLGNVRAVLNSTGNVVQRQGYYPFGGTFQGWTSTNPRNQYLNQGKEVQEEFGTYDFEWRMYDPFSVRTWQIDPHTSNYYDLSPYSWLANNPLSIIDPDGRDIEFVRLEGQSKKEFRQAKREFRRRNNQLSRDSKTHKKNYKQLKKSDNTHTISFDKEKGSFVEPQGDKDRINGNDTNININLDQESDGNQGNEFVISHELAHAVADDNGSSSPFQTEVDFSDPNFVKNRAKNVFITETKNREFNEEYAGHIENVVRGEVSQSRQKEIPLRKTVSFDERSVFLGRTRIRTKSVGIIRVGFDYNLFKKE